MDILDIDSRIDHAANVFDQVLRNRINQLDSVIESRLSQFQEMLNGIKITNQVEMPVVKQAQPNE